MSLVHRLKYALTLVTIEPMVLVQGVADYIAEVPEAQMVLYKTCRGKQSSYRKFLAADSSSSSPKVVCLL